MSTESDNKVIALSCHDCRKKFLDSRKQIVDEKLHTQEREKPFTYETCGNVSEEKQMSAHEMQSHITESMKAENNLFCSSKMCGKEKDAVTTSDENIVRDKFIVIESNGSLKKSGRPSIDFNLCVGSLETVSVFKEPQLSNENKANEMTKDVSTQQEETISNPSVKRIRHICPVCQMSLANTETLKSHTAAHFCNTFSSCETCHLNFQTENALRRHKSQMHAGRKNHWQRKQNVRNFVEPSRAKPRQQISKKTTLEVKLTLSHNPINVRRSPSEDPHLWPKVFLSEDLNNLFKFRVSV